jgi:hypothetical protein
LLLIGLDGVTKMALVLPKKMKRKEKVLMVVLEANKLQIFLN